MDKISICEALNQNIQEIDIMQNEITMLQLAKFQKSIEIIRNNKINELNNFFEQQINYYNQKQEEYNDIIDNCINKYNVEFDKMINVYENLFINTFNSLKNALNNQKIAIANIITLIEKREDNQISEIEKEKNNKTIIALAQKKLNYGVIIEESYARMKWTIEDCLGKVDIIFNNNVNQMVIYNDNILKKIANIIINKFKGKTKLKNAINNYENEQLKRIYVKNAENIIEIATIIKAYSKQMDEVKKQITNEYNKVA